MFKFLLSLFLIFLTQFVKSQTVDFTFANNNGSVGFCNPASINFTPVCTGNPIGFTWYFGNGLTSNSAIPSIVFTTGTYSVKLVAVFQNVALEITKTIVVNPSVTSTFTSNNNYFCKFDTAKFTCTTNANNPSFTYNFDDGSAPITSNNNTINHYYAAYGSYYANVSVTSAEGCTDNLTNLIIVKKLPITATVTPGSGCAPINANFISSVQLPPNSSVTNYTWAFGDLTPATNTSISSTSHTYIDSGTYTPTLNVTTIEGCTNNYDFAPISFGKPPTITTAYPKKTVYCGNEFAIFVAKSNFANAYKWEYGDGSIDSIPDTLAVHKYLTLGIKIVKVTPIFNGCAGTPVIFTVNIVGVIANYIYANTCTAKKTFRFTNLTQGSQIVSTWNFGDGSNISNTPNPLHTYPQVGTFNTTLTVLDNVTGCRDTITYPIYTANPSLIDADTFLCRNANTTFSLLNNYSNPAAFNIWSVAGLPDTIAYSPITVNASLFGNFFTHKVIINNGSQYCLDTIVLNKLISVRGPNLGYNTSTSFCTNNNFIITNFSTPYSMMDTVRSWNWTFGIEDLTSNTYQPPPFIYTAEGSYTIKLVAKDKKGCSDSLEKIILVKESPFLRIFPRSANICAARPITFTAYHTDTLVWMPANIVSCTTCDTTIATAQSTTTLYAIASNAAGCSLKDSSIITVSTPFTASASISTFFACKNDTVRLTGILPQNKKIIWTPTVGLSNSTAYNPLVTFITDTTYTALLTDSANCYSSSITLKAKLYPPAAVNAGPDRILAYNSPFTITPTYSADVTSYAWAPAGNLNCTNCPTPSGLADKLQTFFVTATNNFNCKSKDTITIAVECAYANLYMASAFSPTNTSVNNYYFPQTRGIKKINKFSVFNRYGQLIYSISNAIPNISIQGWDGKYRGELQPAVGYVYALEATCEQGELLTKQGSFLLVR